MAKTPKSAKSEKTAKTATLRLYRTATGQVEETQVDASAFGTRSPRRAQREAVLMYRANQRAGTHDTLTRAEVNATIRKPWKQKHTGRARAGRTSSPLWRGGGIIFGPHPRDYSYALPRRALRYATRAAMAGKIAAGEVALVDAVEMKAPKTREMKKLLAGAGATRTALIVLPEHCENAWKSARNIQGITVKAAREVNAYDILAHRTVILTPRSYELLRERVCTPTGASGRAAGARRAGEEE
ncbi:MAG: 50S ribosomal protein L4 [Planctomycetes bacterium]|nr:50S ribosomal protein L4 [Planctomycetota bacterium]